MNFEKNYLQNNFDNKPVHIDKLFEHEDEFMEMCFPSKINKITKTPQINNDHLKNSLANDSKNMKKIEIKNKKKNLKR
jgi:hypothetical protein